MNSRNAQQPKLERLETTYRGIPSVQAILNSVHPSWDGSITLQSARDIINHRNMLLQAFWPAEKLISTTSLKAADEAMPAMDPGCSMPLYAILTVPEKPDVHRRVNMGRLRSTTTTDSDVSYRGSHPGNYSFDPAY